MIHFLASKGELPLSPHECVIVITTHTGVICSGLQKRLVVVVIPATLSPTSLLQKSLETEFKEREGQRDGRGRGEEREEGGKEGWRKERRVGREEGGRERQREERRVGIERRGREGEMEKGERRVSREGGRKGKERERPQNEIHSPLLPPPSIYPHLKSYNSGRHGGDWVLTVARSSCLGCDVWSSCNA